MAQKDLIPFNQMTEEEQKKIASKGGVASGKARQERKTLKETLLLLLEEDNNQDNITIALLKEAMGGNVKAFEVLRDTIGQKPVDIKQVEVQTTNEKLNSLIENIDKLKE